MSLTDAAALIRQARRVALVTHVAPDPDAIGSLLGLGLGLRDLGKQIALLDDDPPPTNVLFLPEIGRVMAALPDGFVPDLVIGLDSSDAERLGQVARPLLSGAVASLNIDHHATNTLYASVNLVQEDAASTAEMIPALLDELGVTITPQIAACLMTGMVGDTVGFSTSAVSPQTFLVAARLTACGANVGEITQQVLKRKTFDTLRLWSIGLANMTLEDGVLWAVIPLRERRLLGLPDDLNGGLSNQLKNVTEAEIAVVFTEKADGRVELSMRANPGYDVADLAFSLGGGGHRLAAGATIDGPLLEAARRVVDLLKQQVREGRG
ncbi:MAG: bifunctional oligoribonuclease/PAP phosphatase NrnA [Anaerolineae bacterium]